MVHLSTLSVPACIPLLGVLSPCSFECSLECQSNVRRAQWHNFSATLVSPTNHATPQVSASTSESHCLATPPSSGIRMMS